MKLTARKCDKSNGVWFVLPTIIYYCWSMVELRFLDYMVQLDFRRGEPMPLLEDLSVDFVKVGDTKSTDPCDNCITPNCDESCVHSDAYKDYREELCTQADALGMESLTEDQQAVVEGHPAQEI